MEKLSVQQKSNKQAKAKKKPIKVVFISNPVEVRASESEFRAVVQELTGRDSDIADIAKFHWIEDTGAGTAAPESSSGARDGLAASETSSGAIDGPSPLRPDAGIDRGVHRCHGIDARKSTACPLEMYDEDSASQMLEDFPAFMPSSLCYEPPRAGAFRSRSAE